MTQKLKRKNNRGKRLSNALHKYELLEANGARPRVLERLSNRIDRLKSHYEARKKNR